MTIGPRITFGYKPVFSPRLSVHQRLCSGYVSSLVGRGRGWLLFLTAIFTALFVCSRCQAQTSFAFGLNVDYGHPDKIYVQSLTASGLHELALQFVESRFTARAQSDSKLSNADAQWLILRAEIRAAQLCTDLDSRYDNPEATNEPLATIRKELLAAGQDPRTPWLEWKSLWCRWFVLRSGTALHLAAPTRSKLRQWCLNELRDTIDKTDRLIEDIKSMPTRDLPALKPDAIDASQVTSLLADTFLLKCDLLSLRATTYPAGSDDRLAAGSQMLRTLDEAELRIARDWADRDKLLVARARSQAFLGLPKKALEIIDAMWNAGKLSSRSLLVASSAIAAEANRMLGDLPQSNAWIERAGGWRTHPSLAIESFTNILYNAHKSESAKEQLEEALAMKKEIGSLFGTYWGSRADAIMLASQPGLVESTANTEMSLELVRTEVRQLLLANRPLDAIDKMAQTEFVLAERNATADALTLAMQTAAIWGLQKEFGNAASEFHRAAMSYPSEPRASEAALNAVGMIKEQLRQIQNETGGTSSEELLQTLALRKQILRDIISVWPSSPQADTASLELELTLLSEMKVLDILDMWLLRLEKVQPQSIDPRNMQALFRRAATWFALVSALGGTAWLEDRIFPSDALPSVIDKFSRFHNLSSRTHATETTTEDLLRQRFLKIGWEPVVPLDVEAWGEDAPLMRLVHRWTQCEIAFQNVMLLAAEPSADLGAMIEILRQSGSMLQANEAQLLGDELANRFQMHLELYRLTARYLSGEREAVIEELKTREAGSPRDPWWIYKAARLLSTNADYRDEALFRFRRLALGFREASEPWLDCRARSIQILILQNKRDEAKQLSELITSLYPELPITWKTRLSIK
ncbi:hypothetical protein SH449x_002451 [Pirellulaceae bacterium SH449]